MEQSSNIPTYTYAGIIATYAKRLSEEGRFYSSTVVGVKNRYRVTFRPLFHREQLPEYVLCSSRNPYEARVFKSVTGAVNELIRLGFNDCMVVLRKDTQDFNIDVVLHTPPDEIPPPL
jgi:hypothetical protein